MSPANMNIVGGTVGKLSTKLTFCYFSIDSDVQSDGLDYPHPFPNYDIRGRL
jgi:hypothetical protein